MNELPFTVDHKGPNVHVVRCNIQDSGNWEQWFLLRSDAHHDNPNCNRKLEYKHLDQAVEKNAGILDCGDLFCAMQGKYDRRSDKSKLRPEHQVSNYLDALVSTAADDYEKYAHRWIVMGAGNHETAILSRLETDLNDRLSHELRRRVPGCPLQKGGYGGYVRFQFARHNERKSYSLKYFHGSGGGGPVTKGVIRTNRMQDMSEADIYWTGHVHESWVMSRDREYLSQADVVKHRRVTHVCTPGYKDEFKDGSGGWWVETGKGVRRLGAYWLRFYYEDGEVQYEFREAQ